MATTLSTNNPNDIGFQTGYFSGVPGTPIDQTFFNNAFAGHINNNKIYKDAYNCNIIGDDYSTMTTWLEEFGGYETDCHPSYTLLEYNGFRHLIKAKEASTIPARSGGTGTITLANADHYVNGQYVLPQVGNTIALAPRGELAEVTAITHATGFDTVITVQIRSTTAGAQVVPINAEMIVLQGKILTDCVCPSGQFSFRDLPIERDVTMIDFAMLGSLCGDAVEKCQFLKIPFYDADGKEISEQSPWFTTAQQDMYRDFEMRKHYETLLNPSFGIIPTIRALGIKFNPASTTEITVADIREWKKLLDKAGVACREYAIFAGRNIYSQLVQMAQTVGVQMLNYQQQPLADCKWLNLEWCGIKVEGMTLHFFDEKSFSNGKLLGAEGMVYPDSAIWVPMGNVPKEIQRSTPATGRNGYSNKMITRVYFRSIQGRVYDMVVDSNGFLNGPGGRNTFGTGCKTHEWSVETRFLNEIRCANAWGYQGLG